MLDRTKISHLLTEWFNAWNRHDLEGVLAFMAEDVQFEHWNGRVLRGKRELRHAWRPWFSSHGDFQFELTSVCIDEAQQAFSIEWQLTWPSPEPRFFGKRELRDGLDVVQLFEGKVISKRTYVKTVLMIDNHPLFLKA